MALSYLSGLNFGNIEEPAGYGIEYKLPNGDIWYIDYPEDLEKYRRLLPGEFENFRRLMIALFSGSKTKIFDLLTPEEKTQGITRWNQQFPQYAIITMQPNTTYTNMKNFTIPSTVQAATKEMKAPSYARNTIMVPSTKVIHSVDEDLIDRKDREMYENEEDEEYMQPGPFGINKNMLLLGGLVLFGFIMANRK
jgi:hypothetical protein